MWWSIISLGIGLAMDAFAVSVSKGTQYKKLSIKVILLCALWFGLFQGIMPLIGYSLASFLIKWISKVDHWVAFILLLGLGIKMIIEATKKENIVPECPPIPQDEPLAQQAISPSTVQNNVKEVKVKKEASVSFKVMLILAIATSIDALAAGVSMITFEPFYAYMAIVLTAIITFVLSGVGVIIGTFFGCRFKRWAELAGGIILILVGLKILLEHLL
jgi:putative Mn2+ efflux pump MntP